MQVMPATGAELKVGDIGQLEPNIHAGVKYMRFMIDRYYANEPMEKLDKALFDIRLVQRRARRGSGTSGKGRRPRARSEQVVQ